MSSRTTIITVTYNSAAILAGLLDTVPHDVPVIVVDNASTDDIAENIAGRRDVRLIRNERNLGFGRACNIGAAAAATEFLFFLNPDARLADGATEALEREADARPGLGAANPLITDPSGHARLKMSSVVDLPDLPKPDLDKAGRMPVLSGAALFVPRAVFEEVGGFDPSIFLYHEDHEICSRIIKAGHDLWHLPAARVMHLHGQSSPNAARSAYRRGYEMARSRYYVIEKSHRGDGFRRTFWPALLGCISPINMISKRRHAKFRGQLAGALSARKDGGRFSHH